MRFINHNKVYWVFNRDLGINLNGGHYVIITWFNRRKNLCRVKIITSLEHKNTTGFQINGKEKAISIIEKALQEYEKNKEELRK